MILLHFKVNQTQNILGERQGKINSNIDEVNIEIIIISQATPIHCSKQGRRVQGILLRGIVKLLGAARSVVCRRHLSNRFINNYSLF